MTEYHYKSLLSWSSFLANFSSSGTLLPDSSSRGTMCWRERSYRAEQVHDLAERDLLVVVGVDDLQEVVHLGVRVADGDLPDQSSELHLVQDAVVVCVDGLEQRPELVQELLVLLQLEVQDGLGELAPQHLLGVLGGQQTELLLTSHFDVGVTTLHADGASDVREA